MAGYEVKWIVYCWISEGWLPGNVEVLVTLLMERCGTGSASTWLIQDSQATGMPELFTDDSRCSNCPPLAYCSFFKTRCLLRVPPYLHWEMLRSVERLWLYLVYGSRNKQRLFSYSTSNGLYNRDGECLLRGMDWVFEWNSGRVNELVGSFPCGSERLSLAYPDLW